MTAGMVARRRTVGRRRDAGKDRYRFTVGNLAVADEKRGGRRLEERTEG